MDAKGGSARACGGLWPGFGVCTRVGGVAAPGGPLMAARSGLGGFTGQTGQTRAGQAGQIGRTGKPGQAGQAGKAGRIGRAGHTGDFLSHGNPDLFGVCNKNGGKCGWADL